MKNWDLGNHSEWYKNWDRFVKFNANPLGKETNDSAVRALAIAFDMTWYDVYDELAAIGRQAGTFGDVSGCVAAFLEKHNAEEVKISRRLWPNVESFAGAHDKGRYVLLVGMELSVLVDGCVYDTKSCTQKLARKAWRVLD